MGTDAVPQEPRPSSKIFTGISFILFILLVILPIITILLWWFPSFVELVRRYVLMYDLIWYLGIIIFYIIWWACIRGKKEASSENTNDLDERKLGADALRGQINSGIVASSFLVAAATFLFGKPFGVESIVPECALLDIQRTVAWLIVALLIGLWNLFSIAGRVNEGNVAIEPYFNLLSVGQLYALLFGVLNFASSLNWLVGL
jgi:hypothetical protein